jgi:hypothetical protein
MDFDKIKMFIAKVGEIAEVAAPIATMLGLPSIKGIKEIVETAIEVGENVAARFEEGVEVINADTAEEIRAMTARLRAINDDLNAKIVAS